MRAQESVSFMIIVGLVILLFLLFSNIISQDIITANNIKFLVNSRSMADKLASAINSVWLSGPGTARVIYLRDASDDYQLLIRSNNVIAVHELGSNTYSTHAPIVIDANISFGKVIITNNGGVINVYQ